LHDETLVYGLACC